MENIHTPFIKRTRIDVKSHDRNIQRNDSFTPKRELLHMKVVSKTPKKEEYTPLNKAKSRFSHSMSRSAQKLDLNTPAHRVKTFDHAYEFGKICVVVRFCPMVTKAMSCSNNSIPFTICDKSIIVKHGLTCDTSSEISATYTYDNVFWSTLDSIYSFSSQKQIFNEVALPLLDAALDGYNACLFAYGQTGSGKTYSMMGIDNVEEAGIIPRFCDELISKTQCQSKFQVNLSYYEIYNEKIHDLLGSSADKENKISLKVREHPVTGPYVENLSSHRVDTFNDLKSLLVLGNSRRATGSTIYNDRSSRSHTILEIVLILSTGGSTVHSKISLVDLAGSERIAHCQASEERFKEGLSINKSLLTLGKVISSLSDLKRGNFIPYRESVLTWLLKESLGGNSRTAMLATVSPSLNAVEETIATLRYACQARHILNKVTVNEDPQMKIVRQLREEIERLKSLKEEFVKNSCESNDNIQHCLSGKTPEEKSKLKQYNLTHIETKQKAVEDQLKFELSRLGMNLEAAERRCDELESQNMAFISQLKSDRVSLYKSTFFENLNSILNESVEESPPIFESVEKDNNAQVFLHLDHVNTSLNALQNIISSTNLNDSLCLGRAQKVLLKMQRDYRELHEILVINSI